MHTKDEGVWEDAECIQSYFRTRDLKKQSRVTFILIDIFNVCYDGIIFG